MLKFKTILFVSFILSFSACTNKYQTNKLPKDEKFMLPTSMKEKRYYLNEEKKEEFRKYVIDNLNNGVDRRKIKGITPENNESINGLWFKGYELDRKRY